MKLGEILVGKGIITRDQLQKALDAQLLVGGHLGTCLIEKNFIEEEQLGVVLAETFNMSYARPDRFEDIPRFVIATLPPKLVVRHSVVPLALENKLLDVAMIDPKNLQAIDELSFAAGYRIRPWISPEVRVFQALERYYDVPRRQRYVALCQQLDQSGPTLDHQLIRLYRDAPEMLARTAETGGQVEPQPGKPKPDDVVVTERDPLSELLCSAENPGQLGEAILSEAGKAGLTRAILFRVTQGAAMFWRSYGVWLDPVTANSLSFSVTTEPIFSLMRGEARYRGELPNDPEYRKFYEKLTMDLPEEILVLPVYLDDRLVALFYGDGGANGAPIKGETDDFRRLMRQLGLALNLVVLRRQIRSA